MRSPQGVSPLFVRGLRGTWRGLILWVCLIGVLTGCATTPRPAESADERDPLEGLNRRSFSVGEAIDRGVLRPIAGGYQRVVPQALRTGVHNFFSNIRGLDSALNGFLQGKPKRGFTDVSRVFINTTLGLGGLFDPATRAGYDYQDEDFGQTLAVWGYEESSYVYLPVVGPLTVRDIPTLLFRFTWPSVTLGDAYNAGTASLDVVAARERALGLSDARDAMALQPYVFTREAYFQRRQFQIHDGQIPASERADKFDEFDELDEFDDQ